MTIESKYKSIGKNEPTDKFLKSFEKAAGSMFWSSSLDKINALANGAIEAFHAGHPENIQTLLLETKDIDFKTHGSDYVSYFAPNTLFGVLKNSSDQKADIELALAKISGKDRQDLLNRTLSKALGYSYAGDILVTALLDAGAEASAQALTSAACNCPPTTVKILYERGASFDGAVELMSGYSAADRERLKFYQKTMTGGSDVTEEKPDALQEIREQLKALTECVIALTEEVRDQKSPIAAGEKVSQEKKSYPSISQKR